MNLREYATMVNEYTAIAGGTVPEAFRDPSLLDNGTDWQKELFNNAGMKSHQLSLSGGGDKTSYFISGEYLTQNGIALGSKFDRYSLRVNTDTKARRWLSIGTSIAVNQTKEKLTTAQENIIATALQMSPQVPVKNFDGSWGGDDPINGANQFSPVNPIAISNLTTNNLTKRQLLGGLNATFDILKGLQLRTAVNTNIGYGTQTYFLPTYRFGTYNYNNIASLEETSNLNTYWNLNQVIEYNTTISRHNVGLMVGHESQSSSWKKNVAGRKNFLTNEVIDVELGEAAQSVAKGGQGDWAMESYFSRLSYNFNEKYILMGTLRADGSSTFGTENRWGIFPSLSAAWRISKEGFFNIDAINELKLTFETGTTGNQGGGNIYPRMSAFATDLGPGFLATAYGNPGLQWESTKTNNIGLNIGLFQNKIQIEADYYVKKTDNLLMEASLPWYMGTNGRGAISAPYVNVGALENKGWGFTVKATPIDKNGFRWDTDLNISGFKTTIEKFNNDNGHLSRISWWLDNWDQRSTVGEAPWLFYGYIEEGLFQSVDEINNSAIPVDNTGDRRPVNRVGGIWVGDVKYKDVSGPEGKPDGIIDSRDQTYIGNPWPKMFGGWTNTFSYKGLELSAVITTTYGNDIYNNTARINSNPNNINLSRNLLKNTMNYAKISPTDGEGNAYIINSGTNVARISEGGDVNGNYNKHTSKWVEDGSFVRIKNIRLTYNLPVNLLDKTKVIKGVTVSVSAQNIATFTKYSGYDPEVGSSVGRDVSAANQAIGLDNGRYPLTPIYSFSLGVNF
jgi:TonB-linked SusC/RagA family outer membrane protein